MDGFKQPENKQPENKKPQQPTRSEESQKTGDSTVQPSSSSDATPPTDESAEPIQATTDEDTDQEADEAVVAGVTAIGGLALRWHHVKGFFKRWWNNKKLRYSTLGGLAAVLIVLFVIPLTRFGILNALGIKATAEIIVIDDETGLPLKSAAVKIGAAEAASDESGRAYVSGVRLGDQEILVTKPGYGDFLEQTRISVGGNQLGEARMVATGTRFAFRIADWHSHQPLDGALAEVGVDGASAFSDEEGLLKLVTPPSEEELEITFSAEGYNDLVLKTDPTNFDEQDIKMVRAGYHAFISKRDGRFDLFSSRLDGSDTTKVVRATGRERESSLALSVDPTGKYAALVSTRDGVRNEDGFILSGLYLVELETGELNRIDLSESVELVGWSDERLIFTTQASGESGYSPQRFRLRSIQLGNVAAETLENSNYFYDVMLANGRIYYAPGESFKQNRPPEHFMSMLPDGSDRRTHLEARTVRVARTDFNTLALETIGQDFNQTWYSFALEGQTAVELEGQPASFEYWSTNAEFISSPDKNWLVWHEKRDGKDVIVLREGGGAERILVTMDGAQPSLSWVHNDLVKFRVVKPGESADYIISLADEDAEAVKLSDVTNVSGH